MKTKQIEYVVSNFKYDSDTGIFECYGNTKGNIDHAEDRAVDGCYQKSISRHKANGTMPKMFWSHQPHELPVGAWLDMKEDQKGLWMKGKLSKTRMGKDIEVLAKDGALDSFSIGYAEVKSRHNHELGCKDLLEVDIFETSWVNFACNEESRLVDIKAKMEDGEMPTKRELQDFLRDNGLSKRQAEKITNAYQPSEKADILEELAKLY